MKYVYTVSDYELFQSIILLKESSERSLLFFLKNIYSYIDKYN